MKIKFIKEYRAIGDFGMPGKAIIARSLIGDTADNLDDEDAQWLIDNGFAEKVKESGQWKPKFDEMYYCLNGNGIIMFETWCNDELDESRYSRGNCFKTKAAAERYRDYLEAVATVSQDDGFMRKSGGGFGWPVIEYTTNNPGVDDIAGRQHAGEFYFDTREHALNSAMNHTREWQTIVNYDWSRE